MKKATSALLAILIALFSHGYFPFDGMFEMGNLPSPRKANAQNTYIPSGGAIVTGTNPAILGLTAPAATGVNTGSWRGARAADNYHFGITPNSASGYNAYIDVDGVRLRGANKIQIQTGIALTATAAQTRIQICDWVTSTAVSNAADAQCTGGGWRTLNLRDALITTTGASQYNFAIYDGYFGLNATSSVATPLANFVSSGKVRIRYFSTTASAGNAFVDYLRVSATINPMYSPSGATVRSDAAPVGNYVNTIIGGVGQTGIDATYFSVPGGTKAADFYFSYKNVHVFGGADTILVRSTYSCSVTNAVINRPTIYNFTKGVWEDITTANITCSTTNATNAWAIRNTAIQDYISNGEVRVGWHALSVNAVQLRVDMMYVMIGSTTNGTQEVTLGTGGSGSALMTRDLDMTGTTNLWTTNAVAKSNTQSVTFHAYDNDANATAGNVASKNMSFTLNPPGNSIVSGMYYAARFRSGAAGTAIIGIQDLAGATSVQGGWTQVGAAVTAVLTYTDNFTAATNLSGGLGGVSANGASYISHETGLVNLRMRTSASAASAFTQEWDFAMVSMSWVEDTDHRTRSGRYTPTGGATVVGGSPARLGLTAPAAAGVNTGGWQGALADDNYHYGITSTASGYNAYLDFDRVHQNGANKIIIQQELVEAATAAQTLVEICDWVSAVGVNHAADAECTGGGWRTVNVNAVPIAPTTATAYDFQIYDGYWNSSPTAKISTPISNFISGANKVRVRFFSTTNTTANVHIDYVRLFVVVSPVYSASSATLIQPTNTIAGSYASSTMGGAGQTGIDTRYLTVAGTATVISDFYMSHTGVRLPPGANSILYRANYSCTAAGPSIRPKIYNFNTLSWENLSTAAVACSTTAATNAWNKYSGTLSDYVNNGEIRIGWYGSVASTVGVRIDMGYIMVGVVTNNTTNLTYGTVSAGTSANTQTLDMTGTLSSWNITSVAKSNSQAFPFNAYDNSANATAGAAASPNMDFTMPPPLGSEVVGVYHAARYMSGTTGTVIIGIQDQAGYTSTQGGWSQVCTTATTALVYCDSISAATVASGGAAGWYTNAQDYVDAATGHMNMRLRTSTQSTAGAVAQWDFAMMSYSWIDTPIPAGSLTFNINGSGVLNFGTLTPASASWATDGGSGSGSEVAAHTVSASSNASGGYVISLSGTVPTSGAATISGIGSTATTSQPGVEQFGIRISLSGGNGFARSPYSSTLYAFDLLAKPDIAANASSDGVSTDYSVYYLANIAPTTDAGKYTSTLTYTMTAGF